MIARSLHCNNSPRKSECECVCVIRGIDSPLFYFNFALKLDSEQENQRFHARFLFLALQEPHKHGATVDCARSFSKRSPREAFEQTLVGPD